MLKDRELQKHKFVVELAQFFNEYVINPYLGYEINRFMPKEEKIEVAATNAPVQYPLVQSLPEKGMVNPH